MRGEGRRSSVQARRFWSGHVESQSSSGLGAAQYCRDHGLSAASFYVWRSRLSSEQSKEPLPEGFREVARDSVQAAGAIEVTAVRLRLAHAGQLGEVLRALAQL